MFYLCHCEVKGGKQISEFHLEVDTREKQRQDSISLQTQGGDPEESRAEDMFI